MVTEQPKQWYKFLTAICAVIGGVFTGKAALRFARHVTLPPYCLGWRGGRCCMLQGCHWHVLHERGMGKGRRRATDTSSACLPGGLPGVCSGPLPPICMPHPPRPAVAGIIDGMVHQVNRITKKVELGKQG